MTSFSRWKASNSLVYFDRRLTFKPHLQYTKTRCLKVRPLSNRRHVLALRPPVLVAVVRTFRWIEVLQTQMNFCEKDLKGDSDQKNQPHSLRIESAVTQHQLGATQWHNVDAQTVLTGSGWRHVGPEVVATAQLDDHPSTIGIHHGRHCGRLHGSSHVLQLPVLFARQVGQIHNVCKIAISYLSRPLVVQHGS